MVLLPAVLCLVSGYLIVELGWPRRAPLASDILLRISLSSGFGLGVFSVVFFLSRVIGVTHLMAVDFLVSALLLAAFLLLRSRVTAASAIAPKNENLDSLAWLHRMLAAAFAIAVCVALYSAVLRALAHPHGDGWDAFAIWNLHARFLFRGGAHWRDGFNALIPWSHPDYPLLLPAAVAHFWTYLGHDAPAVPAIISLVFTFSTLGLLFSSLALLRGRTSAFLGGLALASTPSFIEQGTSQYADVPLSFFFLAAIVLQCLYEHYRRDTSAPGHRGLLVLAGLATGMAAWTKNEGSLFLCSVVVARLLVGVRFRRGPVAARDNLEESNSGHGLGETWTTLAPLLISIAPAFLLVAWFKHSIAPAGDLFSDRATTLHKMLDPTRYWAIAKWYAKEFFRFGHWLLIPGTLLLTGLYFAVDGKDFPRPGLRTSAITLALTVAGYFAVYLITPYPIYWHLRFSLSRLFLQVWPSAIFVFFLMIRPNNPATDHTDFHG